MAGIRVVTWNIHNGGVDNGDDTRLRRQWDLLADLEPDLVAIQEAKWPLHGNRRLHAMARYLAMTGRTAAPSNHHGCDLVTLVRERPGLWMVEERHDLSGAYWHALANVRVHLDGIGEIDFLNAHLAPSSPGRRANEGETFALWKNRPAIAAGDFNAVAHDTDPGLDARAAEPVAAAAEGKLDERPAAAMARAGFRDAAAEVGDPTPTVGYTTGHFAHRCDRILFANIDATVTHYRVIPARHPDTTRRLSDHDLVVAEVNIEGTP